MCGLLKGGLLTDGGPAVGEGVMSICEGLVKVRSLFLTPDGLSLSAIDCIK